MTLTADQILALAPDASSAKAGSQLAQPAKWGNLGCADGVLWGECQGSGKDPYRTQIDCSEPAFKCSCPSRKFPCKHGLGLYLLHASHAGLFGGAEPPPWVRDWLESRQQRAAKKEEKAARVAELAARELTPEEVEAAAAQARKREEKRDTRVVRGLDELQTWLQDLAREGWDGMRNRGPAAWETMAARMVDAQAPGLAARLLRAGALAFQSDLAGRDVQLARELAALYLLTGAYRRIDTLPPALQADVRIQAGWTVSRDDVLAQPGVTDCWQVLAQSHSAEERGRSRATWLRGAGTGRWALLLHFAVAGQGYEQALTIGTQFQGTLHFYPGAWPQRALLSTQQDLQTIAALPALASLDQALEDYADALAANPFLERYPMALGAVTPQFEGQHGALRSADGRMLPLSPAFGEPWRLLALSGGHPVTVAGVWDGHALAPLSVWSGGRLFTLESEPAP
jgi:hypothetical protein